MRDKGIAGVVLYMGWGLPCSVSVEKENTQHVWASVPAQFTKAALAEWALEHSYTGLEFSAGIPGTMGGAVYMNAGTKWGSYGDVIEGVRFFSPEHGFYQKTKEEIGFKYRGHGEGMLDAWTIVTNIFLKLKKDIGPQKIRELMDEILIYRGSKQPLELPNCGSVFKNPSNSEKGAGRLIEACGLKGTCIGGAQVSEKHANFILNLGTATAADIEGLMALVQKKVFEKFQIQLEREAIILGKA